MPGFIQEVREAWLSAMANGDLTQFADWMEENFRTGRMSLTVGTSAGVAGKFQLRLLINSVRFACLMEEEEIGVGAFYAMEDIGALIEGAKASEMLDLETQMLL